jgi:hypothetical protein
MFAMQVCRRDAANVQTRPMQFGDWQALTPVGVDAAHDGPAAVQVARADRQLVSYPHGKSAMVFYFYAARSAREALSRLFDDELQEPGARGEGALAFRLCPGGEPAKAWLEELFDRFIAEFGRAPILHPDDDDE